MNPEDIRQNVRNGETWERAVPMLVYFIAYYFVIQAILVAIMLVQFASQLLFQKKFEHLYDFSIDLTNYSRNIWLYLTFTSERKLFPFAEWSSSCLLEEPLPHHHDV
ncbi:MAG: DUF4389 domain-containing protein [Oligoflexus sp.]|jgi:hypothetical protein